MCLTLSSWVLGNFGLFLFALAALIITLQLSSRQHVSIAEIFYRWIALLPLGCTGIYAFVIHAFFPAISALTIGWPASLFQFEVALANLSFGILGILSFKASYGFRLATVIGATFWLWGDAGVHISQMVEHQNFMNGNAGSWFWMDLLVPLILLICIVLIRPKARG
jgi:hypothetical protein